MAGVGPERHIFICGFRSALACTALECWYIIVKVAKLRNIVRMAGLETNRRKIVRRLEREGWTDAGGGKHDIYRHEQRVGRIVVPRHRELSPRVAREIAKIAGWDE